MMDPCPFVKEAENYIGELTELYLQDLGKDLDNVREYERSWRQFGVILMNLDTRELDDIWRRSNADTKCSPTWSLYQRYLTSRNSSLVDIKKLWCILHYQMKREDSALKLYQWYRSNELFRHQLQQSRTGDVLSGPSQPESFATQPPRESDFTGARVAHLQQTCLSEDRLLGQAQPLSFATYPPEEGSDISSLRNNDLPQPFRVKDLTLHADNVRIVCPNHTRRRQRSTETDSLNSSSTGSTSSLPTEQDVADQPSRVALPLTPPSEALEVFITYADHDEQKAVDIGMHLSFYGCKVTLDNPDRMSERERKRRCKSIFKQVAVIVVVYSTFYKHDVVKRGSGSRNTRYIYNLLKEDFEKNKSNRRSVLYPMYQIQRGSKIPRIFNHLPTDNHALTIHGLLFRQTKQ